MTGWDMRISQMVSSLEAIFMRFSSLTPRRTRICSWLTPCLAMISFISPIMPSARPIRLAIYPSIKPKSSGVLLASTIFFIQPSSRHFLRNNSFEEMMLSMHAGSSRQSESISERWFSQMSWNTASISAVMGSLYCSANRVKTFLPSSSISDLRHIGFMLNNYRHCFIKSCWLMKSYYL